MFTFLRRLFGILLLLASLGLLAWALWPAQVSQAAQAFNVAFLVEPLDEASIQKLMALKTDIDNFQAHGREIYWLCRKKQSESTFSNAVLEKTLARRATLRGVSTVKKIAAIHT